MLAGRHILCVGPDLWHHSDAGRTLACMRRLARYNSILYVDSFSNDVPRPVAYQQVRQLCYRRGLNRKRRLEQDVSGLHWFHPSYLRNVRAEEDEVPDPLLMLDLAMACSLCALRPDLLWLADPRGRGIRRWLKGVPLVYQVEDVLADRAAAGDRERLRRHEDVVLAEADAVLCGSRALEIRMRGRVGRRARYVPHGIHAAAWKRPAETPRWLAAIPSPRVGFWGSLTKHHDTGLLAECARRMPWVSFVVAGPGGEYFGGLRRLPNVHWISGVRPGAAPAFLQGVDVCLLPLRAKSWLASGMPPQLLPYLASGRPIVSTPLGQVCWMAGSLVGVAKGPEEFARAIQQEGTSDTPEREAGRQALAAEHDWSGYATRVGAALEGVAGGPGLDPMASFVEYFHGYRREAKEQVAKSGDWEARLLHEVAEDAVRMVLGWGRGK